MTQSVCNKGSEGVLGVVGGSLWVECVAERVEGGREVERWGERAV